MHLVQENERYPWSPPPISEPRIRNFISKIRNSLDQHWWWELNFISKIQLLAVIIIICGSFFLKKNAINNPLFYFSFRIWHQIQENRKITVVGWRSAHDDDWWPLMLTFSNALHTHDWWADYCFSLSLCSVRPIKRECCRRVKVSSLSLITIHFYLLVSFLNFIL